MPKVGSQKWQPCAEIGVLFTPQQKPENWAMNVAYAACGIVQKRFWVGGAATESSGEKKILNAAAVS